ncbi:rRNA maturation RNase YbeY [Acetobacteraceae bacterium KSS8]|uniref:Endoribonuclease YbeY n=1 Tax=Endosaccharibacter trunci TaxID=2812733 RepID=A0ABT1WA16_9PROT|nr:rRNA maturation RNase YbeY [Acetobacteraceae bacterium KSS8]
MANEAAKPAHDVAGVSRHAAARRLAEAPEAVEIFVVDHRWRRLVPGIERLARRAAAAGGGAGSVVLDNDLRIRHLNARHRGKNKPTNVLTFETPPGVPGGDIVVALETVRREAIAAGRRPRHHLAHLIVHGALHLRGHDHHRAGDARRMEMEEARILRRLGVPNPWKPASPRPAGELRR